MKKLFALMTGVLLFSSILILPSCNSEEPTIGILVISVIDTTNTPVANEQVYLAASYEDMIAKNYLGSKWTNQEGIVTFINLPPLIYWYDTEHFENWGAIQVYAGIEQLVTLRVNTTQP